MFLNFDLPCATFISNTLFMSKKVLVFSDREALSRAAAERLAEVVEATLATKSRVAIALAGGSTPRRLYEILAQIYRDRLPWNRIHLFWGDERFVPADHPSSNYRMAHDALLRHLPTHPRRVHPILTDAESPEDAAAAYEVTLWQFFQNPQPAFDLTLLGLGDDGHTASLFPENTPQTALAEDSTGRQVEAVVAPPRYAVRRRITLTLPALNASRHVFFLVAGEGKRDVLRTVLDDADAALPAAHVRAQETLTWFVDEAAYGEVG